MTLGVILASALVGGVTAYTVSKNAKAIDTKIVEFMPSAGTHFTSYEREKYPDLTYAAENAVQAVVNIVKTEEVRIQTSRNPFFEFFGFPEGYSEQAPLSRESKSGGSGVIISPDGYIVTNNHVVENASKLKVTLYDDRSYDATIIGTDPTTDIALIKIEDKDLPTLPFGNSEELRLGEWVLAIGSPYDLRSTVTAGIVSAKARNLNVIPSQFSIESFIQTDAAVNPGNSGGALVNVKGELVGINTVIKSPTGSFAGYSFAVPETIVRKVVVDLKEFGVVQRAMLGIQFNEINSDFLEQFGEKYGIEEKKGVYVSGLDPDGAAKAAGIKEGDVIIEIDGVKIESSSTVLEQIAKRRPNDNVKITLKRDGNVKHFDVVLRNKAGKAELLKKDYVDAVQSLGGKFSDITDKEKSDLKIKGGIKVVGIESGGLLSKARVRTGYVITHINERAVGSVTDIAKITSKIESIDGVYPDGRSASYSFVH